jgi:hypothetical protein
MDELAGAMQFLSARASGDFGITLPCSLFQRGDHLFIHGNFYWTIVLLLSTNHGNSTHYPIRTKAQLIKQVSVLE